MDNVSKGTKLLIKGASIAAAVITLGAAYSFFLNYVYRPQVEVVEADFDKGTAKIKVKGLFPREFNIQGETLYQIFGDWGIRFASSRTAYNRIELVRKGMVTEYLYKPSA